MVGTPYYLSPEIINGKPYSFKSDIWSLGVVLYEMCALKPPFDAQNITFLAMKIVKGQYSPVPYQFSKELKNLVASLLQIDSLRRPSVNEVLKFPIIQNRIQNFLSKSVKIQEFSHTILHKQNFVKNEMRIDNIKSVNNEAPIPLHLIKAQQEKEKEKERIANIPKPAILNTPNVQPQARPSPAVGNNLVPSSNRDEKPEVVQRQTPSANRPVYNVYNPQQNSPNKQNYHLRNSPNPEPKPEPYKGPRIVDGSKPVEQKNSAQQNGHQPKTNGDEKSNNNWLKNAHVTPKDKPIYQPPEKRGVNLTPQQSNKMINKAAPETNIRQVPQQSNINRVEATKKRNDRDIVGGGGGGMMAFNFAPASNKNAVDAGKKRDLFGPSTATKKKPSNPTPVKKNEPTQREIEAAQQKVLDMKKKNEEERIKREKKLLEEAEKKQYAEDQKLERRREDDERRRLMKQDMQNRKNAAKKGKAAGVQFEVLDLHGNSLNELNQNAEEGKGEDDYESAPLHVHKEKSSPPKVNDAKSKVEEVKIDGNRRHSLEDRIDQKSVKEQMAAKNRRATNAPTATKKDVKYNKQRSSAAEDKFQIEIFVPGKNAPVKFDEEETNADTNPVTNDSENLLPDELKARDSDSTPKTGTRGDVDAGGSDLGTILDTAPDFADDDAEEGGQDPFISKLEHDIETYDQNNFVDQKGLENLQNFNDLCDELSRAINPEDENEIERAIRPDDHAEQGGDDDNDINDDDDDDDDYDRDDDLSDPSLDEVQETPNPKQEADEETMEFLMDYSKLECLKMKLESILGTDVFYEAYRIFKDLTHTLDEIQDKYRKNDHYKSLFPFMSDEARERDLEFVFTYVVCEENAEKQGL